MDVTSSKGKVFVVGNDPTVSALWFNEGYTLLRSDMSQADIVCFIGGWDLDPALYGEVKNPKARVQVGSIEDKRDVQAWNTIKPGVLKIGICRGGQFLNVMNGGKMIQHVSGHGSNHKVFDTIKKKEVVVTSSHHQMMLPAETAEVFAYSENIGSNFTGQYGDYEPPEFEAEALWYDETRSLCYQPHPEWESLKEGGRYFFDIVNMVK